MIDVAACGCTQSIFGKHLFLTPPFSRQHTHTPGEQIVWITQTRITIECLHDTDVVHVHAVDMHVDEESIRAWIGCSDGTGVGMKEQDDPHSTHNTHSEHPPPVCTFNTRTHPPPIKVCSH